MGRRQQKPAAPYARNTPIFPTPAPADYSDEVSDRDLATLKKMVRDNDKRKKNTDGDEWELVDGPAW